MNTLLEPSADASGICPNEVLPHLVDAGHTADHTKPDEFLFGRDFEEKFRASKNLEKTSKDLGTANFSGKTSAETPGSSKKGDETIQRATTTLPECSNQEVHQAKQGPLEVSSSAQLAGRLSGYTAWSNIADNPTILSWYVYHIGGKFHRITRFLQKNCSSCAKAIAELMDMGAVVHCAPVEGQYLSKIFLTDKANGTKRFILNLK
nr:unnamed protein product [Callosobruchus chinensis]CAH7754940.1 unnamed protein product [Callosobruchus chinensis]